MTTLTMLIILVVVLAGCLVLTVVYFSRKGESSTDSKVLENNFSHMIQMMRDMENKVLSGEREMKRSVETQFQESQKLISEITEKMRVGDSETRKAFSDQFSSANKLISEITREITEVKEGNKQVLGITEQLSNLEKVLTNQKARGNWGESSLEHILSNFLPGSFQTQYMFKNKEVVDAVVKIKDKLLPIDSKFSLDNYQKCIDSENDEDRKFYGKEFKNDLKKRITETAKYINEKENTLPIAFMFIPAEGIYNDILSGAQGRIGESAQDVIEYAQKNKVFIVSPTSIIAYFHLVLSGIKAFNIEERAKDIQKNIADLSKHMQKFEEGYKKMGGSLSAAVSHYNSGYSTLVRIDKDVYKVTDGEEGKKIEADLIEKPQLEE